MLRWSKYGARMLWKSVPPTSLTCVYKHIHIRTTHKTYKCETLLVKKKTKKIKPNLRDNIKKMR